MKQYGRMELYVEVDGQYHVSAALSTEKEPAVPMDGEILGVQNRSGRFRSREVLLICTSNPTAIFRLSSPQPIR